MAFTMPEIPADTPEDIAAARTRRGRGSAAKGAKAERDVLEAIRAAMRIVEGEAKAEGLAFVARSDFTTRKRIEKGTSNRDLGNIPLISVEIKRNETLNVKAAWEQTLRQTDGTLLPVLIYRFNREPWRVRTWVALTSVDARIVDYTVADVEYFAFLAYFSKLYAAYLREGQ